MKILKIHFIDKKIRGGIINIFNMKEKTNIIIDKKAFIFVISTITILLFLTLIVEHFGHFKFSGYGGDWSNKITGIKFYTPFGSIVETDGKGYTYRDTVNSLGKFHDNYFIKLPFYIKAVFKDVLYPLSTSVVIITIYFVRRKFNLTIK